jgi:hypothetical protein
MTTTIEEMSGNKETRTGLVVDNCGRHGSWAESAMDPSVAADSAYPHELANEYTIQFMPGDIALNVSTFSSNQNTIEHDNAQMVANSLSAFGKKGETSAQVTQQLVFAGVIQGKLRWLENNLVQLQVGGTVSIVNRGVYTINPGDYVAIVAPWTPADNRHPVGRFDPARFQGGLSKEPPSKLHPWLEVISPTLVGGLAANLIRVKDQSVETLRAALTRAFGFAAMVAADMIRENDLAAELPKLRDNIQQWAYMMGAAEIPVTRPTANIMVPQPTGIERWTVQQQNEFREKFQRRLIGTERGAPVGQDLLVAETGSYTQGNVTIPKYGSTDHRVIATNHRNLLVELVAEFNGFNMSISNRIMGKAMKRATPGEWLKIFLGGYCIN